MQLYFRRTHSCEGGLGLNYLADTRHTSLQATQLSDFTELNWALTPRTRCAPKISAKKPGFGEISALLRGVGNPHSIHSAATLLFCIGWARGVGTCESDSPGSEATLKDPKVLAAVCHLGVDLSESLGIRQLVPASASSVKLCW